MGKASSQLAERLGRLVKSLVAALLVLPVIGLVLSLLAALAAVPAGSRPASSWFLGGLTGYVGMHLLLYRPSGLFQLNHALLARLAVWLFGGQVSTVGGEGATAKPAKGRKAKGKESGDASEGGGQGVSTLVVISPYLVPLYVVLVALAFWSLQRWTGHEAAWWNPLVSALVGIAFAFHVAMTGEDLQRQAQQVTIETRLMALAISGASSLALTAVCLPLALPGFSMPAVFTEAGTRTSQLYAHLINTLFF